MSTQILMPALSPTMTEGKLARWLKKVGDEVRSGDVIAEIETDKATMEVEAVDEGKLAKILVEEGAEGVAVNTPIAVLSVNGESVGNGEAPGGAVVQAAPAAKAPAAPSPAPAPAPAPAQAAVPAIAGEKDWGPTAPHTVREALRWRWKCAPTIACSCSARKSRSIRAPTRSARDCSTSSDRAA
jgi:pyruvate dehydrogenase E1 component beta subunit